jgi:poly(3-hydroxybutyrate) depolymerase
MNRRKIVIRAVLVVIGLPIVLVLLAFGFFYSVFYFPNWTSATTGTIVSSGEKREYLLYVPKSYDRAKPTPLVISLHTSMSWPSSSMAISQWNLVADEQGLVVVYPAGTGRGPKSWEMTGSEMPSRMPDVIFISELIDKLEESYNIDKTRIYANGMSNGGGMAFVLSCTMSDRIAAVGMVSAGLDPGWSWCTDHRPVPVIAFHGTADPICLYNGGWSKLAGGTECSGLYGELVSAKPVRTESDRICGRCGCHAPPIHGLRGRSGRGALHGQGRRPSVARRQAGSGGMDDRAV